MRYRCVNAKCRHYVSYGGRGITFCKEWESFEQFLLDMGPRPSKKHSLERVDNNGNYCKENCKWATQKDQSRNTRNRTELTFNGVTKRLYEWAEHLNISDAALCNRLGRLGWGIDRALSTPCDKNKYRRGGTVAAMAKQAGIHRNYVYSRMKKGMSPSEALSDAIKYRDRNL